MLTPLNAKQWDLTKAAHLLNRAGFGGSPEQIKAFCELGFDGAVKQVLNAPDDSAQFPNPGWAAPQNLVEMRQMAQNLPEDQRKEKVKKVQKEMKQHGVDLIDWWMARMATTPNPYREKLTLFWHGHFATSMQKVKDAYLMWQQNELLRRNALGNFGTMVKEISRDPAMLVWLDTRTSRKDHPNENFARELMELFTLGIGNYTEEDIAQSARAFTGYRMDPRDESFHYAPFQHDDTEKKFFGKTGNFGGDDIINLILQKPQCAQYITKKIWEFYAYEDPQPTLVNVLAARFQQHNYEIKPLMNEMFRSAEFYSPDAIRTQIKSPVQWVVQTVKILQTDLPRGPIVANMLRQLGQVPFVPPSVKGWDGGKAWITTSTLLLRYNLANFAIGNGPINVQRMRKVAGNNAAVKAGIPGGKSRGARLCQNRAGRAAQ